MGLWAKQVRSWLGCRERISQAYHAEYVLDDLVVLMCGGVLLLWEDFPQVDCQFQCSSHVIR